MSKKESSSYELTEIKLPPPKEKWLNPSDLLLGYTEFKNLDKSKLSDAEQEWLKEWELWDLAISPMDDERRKILRYGHHEGWFDSFKEIGKLRKLIKEMYPKAGDLMNAQKET